MRHFSSATFLRRSRRSLSRAFTSALSPFFSGGWAHTCAAVEATSASSTPPHIANRSRLVMVATPSYYPCNVSHLPFCIPLTCSTQPAPCSRCGQARRRIGGLFRARAFLDLNRDYFPRHALGVSHNEVGCLQPGEDLHLLAVLVTDLDRRPPRLPAADDVDRGLRSVRGLAG